MYSASFLTSSTVLRGTIYPISKHSLQQYDCFYFIWGQLPFLNQIWCKINRKIIMIAIVVG
jgi:hypothetical protein